jgi:hypothetical protein
MAPLYANYGRFLISHYPITYLRYYLLPNAIKYYTPPGEFLDVYNMGQDTVADIAQNWFGYKTKKVRSVFKDKEVPIIGFVPILSGVMNVLFLLGFLSVGILRGLRKRSVTSHILILAIILWVTNFCFSVFAAPITLRYQLFSIVIFTSFAWILLDHIYKQAFIIKTAQNI